MVSNPKVRFGEGGGVDFTIPSGFVIIPWGFSLLLVVFGIIGSIVGLVATDWGGCSWRWNFCRPWLLTRDVANPHKIAKGI